LQQTGVNVCVTRHGVSDFYVEGLTSLATFEIDFKLPAMSPIVDSAETTVKVATTIVIAK